MDNKITKIVGIIGDAHGEADREQDVLVMYDNNTYGVVTALYNYTAEYNDYMDHNSSEPEWDEWSDYYDGNNITIDRTHEYNITNVPQVEVRGYDKVTPNWDVLGRNYTISKINDTEYQVNWIEE